MITGATTLPATAIVPTTTTHATTATTLGRGDTMKMKTTAIAAAVTAAVTVDGGARGRQTNADVRRRGGQHLLSQIQARLSSGPLRLNLYSSLTDP